MNDIDPIEAAFRAALADLSPGPGVPAVEPVGVAVSGGGDSMALLALAARAGFTLRAVTVDHGLRPEAAGEAALVARFCRAAGLTHDVIRLADLEAGPNLAARARRARYRALADWGAEHGIASVLLGHTLDDQAETVLMRLARGSGADGLAAMAPSRDWAGVRWRRPLLEIDRADLRTWLRGQAIAWAEDPTNDDTGYLRVQVRQALPALAQLGLTPARLAGTARTLARQRDVLERAGADLARVAVTSGGLGEIYLDPAALRGALPDTALRVLADALQAVSGSPYRPRLAMLESVLAGVIAPGFRGATLSGCRLVPDGVQVAICREPAALAPVALRAGSQWWDGRWQVQVPAAADRWIAPLGDGGLQRATAEMRRAALSPPPGWSSAPGAARQAVPAIYRHPSAGPDDLAGVPSVGLVLDPAATGIAIRPPGAASRNGFA